MGFGRVIREEAARKVREDCVRGPHLFSSVLAHVEWLTQHGHALLAPNLQPTLTPSSCHRTYVFRNLLSRIYRLLVTAAQFRT